MKPTLALTLGLWLIGPTAGPSVPHGASPFDQSTPGAPGAPGDALSPRAKGRVGAPVTVYEMADFQCPACRMFTITVFPTIEREFVATGKVRWIYINLPLTHIHPNAIPAAEVAMCAARQGRFWQTHDLLYQQQNEWARLAKPRAMLVSLAQRAGADRAKLIACITSGTAKAEVEKDSKLAQRAGARSTPSFYIEGGLLEGAPYTPDPMRKLLDSVYAARAARAPRVDPRPR